MITLKSLREIKLMKHAGHILGLTHKFLYENSKVGVSLLDLDEAARKLILANDAEPAFLGYQGFPNTVCASVNEILIHGIPTSYRLQEGDVVSYDVGVKYQNYFSDAAFTMGIGTISAVDTKLIKTTQTALDQAIILCRPGLNLNVLAKAIYKIITDAGYFTPTEYSGHGIGQNLHEPPFVLNYPVQHEISSLKKGMVIAIEPMVIQDNNQVKVLDDGWSVIAKSQKNSAHFEHTIAILQDGAEILSVINNE